MTRHCQRFIVAFLLLLAMANLLSAAVKLPGIIADGMVLQQGTKVRLWGWADPGEKVTVQFQQQTVATTAKDGEWELWLAPLTAGGPYPMTITGNNTISFKAVYVGEVWVSCGQSNMMMGLERVENGNTAITESTQYPTIRYWCPGYQPSDTPLDNLQAPWQQANPNTLGGFSAVSYFFGREINKTQHVPVGLINLVAIMPAESWVDRETLLLTPSLAGMINNPIKPVVAYNCMIAPICKYTIRGAIYYQGEYNAGRGKQFRTLMPAVIASWRKSGLSGTSPSSSCNCRGSISRWPRRTKNSTCRMLC